MAECLRNPTYVGSNKLSLKKYCQEEEHLGHNQLTLADLLVEMRLLGIASDNYYAI